MKVCEHHQLNFDDEQFDELVKLFTPFILERTQDNEIRCRECIKLLEK